MATPIFFDKLVTEKKEREAIGFFSRAVTFSLSHVLFYAKAHSGPDVTLYIPIYMIIME